MRVYEVGRKANVLPIVRAHFETMSDFREEQVSALDFVFFYGIPSLLGGLLVYFKQGFRIDAVNGFLNAFAILTGLMLNLLVLVFTLSASTLSQKAVTPSEKSDYYFRRKILKEVFVNVCYCILVAIGVTATALYSLAFMKSVAGAQTDRVSTFILSSLTANFVLSLLMIIKRMYKLIVREFDKNGLRQAA